MKLMNKKINFLNFILFFFFVVINIKIKIKFFILPYVHYKNNNIEESKDKQKIRHGETHCFYIYEY